MGSYGGASSSLLNSSGAGCEAGAAGSGLPSTDCNPTSLPFVFGVPQTLTLSLEAYAASAYGVLAGGSAGSPAYFSFFSVSGQQLSGVTYTFTPVPAPVPEPGMFPLLAAMACAAPIACKRLRKS